MLEEREGQRRRAPNAPHAGAQRPLDLTEMVAAEVGELLAFDVAPHQFDRVEVGRVPRQPFDGEPVALAPQVGGHDAALVRRQAVPDQDDAVPMNVALEILQKVDEGDVVVAPRLRLEEQATAAAVPPEGQRQRDGEFRPVEGVDQDRRFAARRPGAADWWALRDSALILKDDPGPLAPSVFFTAGQRVVTQ